MRRFVEGCDRRQIALLPDCLDDYVSEDSPVRVVDVFIDELDLAALGFSGVVPEATGRPSYHPATLLKIYLYGYLNQVQSSRRLEREARRNIEVMWLTGKLAPDFKTIADFRRDNGDAILAACRQFVVVGRGLGLNSGAREALRRQMQQLKEMEQAIAEARDHQVSLTDPDARAMATNGKGTGMVGYNVQTVVDAKHHLIVAHEVTNIGHDKHQLANMARQAKEVTGADGLTVLADRGYFSGEEVVACEAAGATPIIPKLLTSGAKADGRFGKQDFVYDAEQDHYTCPAGAKRTKANRRADHTEDFDFYRHLSACFTCPLRPQCTPTKLRRIRRWKNEDVLDRMQARLDRIPDAMRTRRSLVEHPFGTIKGWMGRDHFRTL